MVSKLEEILLGTNKNNLTERDSFYLNQSHPDLFLSELELYLKKGGEKLTLDEYLKVRNIIETSYRLYIGQAFQQGKIKQEKVKKVGQLFRDFIILEHYRLLELPKQERSRKFAGNHLDNHSYECLEEPKAKGFFKRAVNLVKDKIKEIQYPNQNSLTYELERIVWDKKRTEPYYEKVEKVKDIANKISSRTINFYKEKTLRMALNKMGLEKEKLNAQYNHHLRYSNLVPKFA